MRLVILINLRYIFENGLTKRIGFSSNHQQEAPRGITEKGLLEEVNNEQEAEQCLVLLSNTFIPLERILQLIPKDNDPLVLVFHLNERGTLRNIYTRLSLEHPEKKILYFYQHSDIGIGTDFLGALAEHKGSRNTFLKSKMELFEEQALYALRGDFVKHNNFLDAYERFLDPQGDCYPIPYLWRRFFERFPQLETLLAAFEEVRGNITQRAALQAEIETYTVL